MSAALLSAKVSYAQWRQYGMDFWEHIAEVVLEEAMKPEEAQVFVHEVIKGLAVIDPPVQVDRHG